MYKTNKMAKNLLVSILAQMVSLFTSFILGIIVPKYIDEFQYAFWQIFVLYRGYAAIFNFGILDGLMLRYSEFDYEQLDKVRVRSQFQVLILINIILCCISCFWASIYLSEVYMWILIYISIGIVVRNIFMFTSYTSQITNRISKYATIVVLQRASYAIAVVIILFVGINDFRWICLVDILGDMVAITLGYMSNRGLYFGKNLKKMELLKETKSNVSAGILLLISNMSSGLVMGSAKIVTQWRWDELVFGKVSFSFSLFSVFFSFIIAISIVLFPTFKRLNIEILPSIYHKMRDVISPLLFFALLGYFPANFLLSFWLPNYSLSLMYLGIILPVVIFTSKISLLTNNFLKIYRKEKIMLIINVLSVAFSFGFSLVSAYILNSLDILMYSLVIVCLLRSIISEIIVMNLIGNKNYKDFIVELIVTVIFVISTRYLSLGHGLIVYSMTLVIYLFLYRGNVSQLIHAILRKVRFN